MSSQHFIRTLETREELSSTELPITRLKLFESIASVQPDPIANLVNDLSTSVAVSLDGHAMLSQDQVVVSVGQEEILLSSSSSPVSTSRDGLV